MGTKVFTSKSSVKVYGDNTEDVLQKASNRAVLNFVTIGQERFYNYWVREFFLRKGQMLAYFRWAEQGNYYLGLPTFEVYGVSFDEVAIANALQTDLGGPDTYEALQVQANSIDIELYFHWFLQDAPWFYAPFVDQLTYLGKTDWTPSNFIFNLNEDFPFLEEYTMDLVRYNKDVVLWVEAVDYEPEGDVINYIIHSNVLIPRGCSIDINLNWTSSNPGVQPVPALPTVTMGEYEQKLIVPITTASTGTLDGPRTLELEIASAVDVNSTFQSVGPETGAGNRASKVVQIIDTTQPTLVAECQLISEEGLTQITVDITLSALNEDLGNPGTPIPFTVDIVALDGSAVNGTDYQFALENLSFAGTAGESQSVVVTWLADVPDTQELNFQLQMQNLTITSSPVTPALPAVTQPNIVVYATIRNQPPVTQGPAIEELAVSLGNPSFDFDEEVLMVQYYNSTQHDESRWYWWLYDYDDGTYSGLEPVYDIQTIDDMYPAGIIRRQKVFINDNKTTEAYRTTRLLLNRVGLNIDDISDNIAEQDGYEDIDDAFTNFAVSPDDNHPLVSRLLFRHFEYIIVTLNLTSNTGEYRTYYKEQDANNETIWYDQFINTDVVGTIPGGNTAVGTFYHEVESFITGYSQPFNDNDTPSPIYADWLYIYHQKTETTYDQIGLRDLRSKSRIQYSGKTRYKVNGIVERPGRWFIPPVDEPEHLTIPISRSIFENNLDYKEQMEVFQYIFRIDVYSIDIVKTKWYESSFFKALFTFAAIVVTVITAGAAASFLVVLQTLIINQLILKLVVYIAEETGNVELAVAIGVIATIALGNFGFGDGFSIGTADALTSSVTKFSNIYDAAQEGQMNILEDELKSIQSQIDELTGEMEDAYDSGITGEYYRNLLQSVDTLIYQGIEGQYNFDAMLGGAYDRLITSYHNNLLQPGSV